MSGNSIDPATGFNVLTVNQENSSTSNSYSLNYAQTIDICIYDVMGNKIETLFNGFQNEGKHSLIFNAKNYSSGVYYCKILLHDKVIVKKLLLLK